MSQRADFHGRSLNVFEILAIALGFVAVRILVDDKYEIVAAAGFAFACSLYNLYVVRSRAAAVIVLIFLALAVITYARLPSAYKLGVFNLSQAVFDQPRLVAER